jgi:uncharacterized phage-associated protein
METLKIKFSYDPKKGLAMLEYLLKLVGGSYNQMALLKLAFFADRYHVRHYARPVSSDEYYALKLGPIPSNLRDIISTERYYPENVSFINDHEVALKSKAIDVDQFSKSDIEAMSFAVEKFAAIGRKNEFYLANLTHAYPEWDKYRKRFEESPLGREDMDYKDFLLNADPNHVEFTKLKFNDPFPLLTPQEQEDVLTEMIDRTLAFA